VKIGILSDTHNLLHPAVPELLKGVEVILHAGDIGQFSLLQKLKGIATVYAVYGNTDGADLRSLLPRNLNVELEGIRFFITHDIGAPERFHAHRQLLPSGGHPDIIVFGHTHRKFFGRIGASQYLNPGSATSPRDSSNASLCILKLSRGKIIQQEFREFLRQA